MNAIQDAPEPSHDIMNITNGRPFMIVRTPPEWPPIQDILDPSFRVQISVLRNVHSGYSGYPEWALNVLNGRYSGQKSGHGPGVLNIMNGSSFVIFRAPRE